MAAHSFPLLGAPQAPSTPRPLPRGPTRWHGHKVAAVTTDHLALPKSSPSGTKCLGQARAGQVMIDIPMRRRPGELAGSELSEPEGSVQEMPRRESPLYRKRAEPVPSPE